MSVKKIVCFIVMIFIFMYLPDFLYHVDTVHFVDSAYLVFYGSKNLFVGISILLLLIYIIKNID